MSPEQVSKRVVVERLEWVARTVQEIESLPLDDHDLFFSDNRNLWTAVTLPTAPRLPDDSARFSCMIG